MKIVVIAMSCLFLAAFGGCKKMTDKDKTFAVMTALDEALKRYRFDCGRFPSNEIGLRGLVDNPAGCAGWKGSYIEWGMDVTKDAWGRPFIYQLIDEGKVAIVSYGADGKPGGSNQDADMIIEVAKKPKGMM